MLKMAWKKKASIKLSISASFAKTLLFGIKRLYFLIRRAAIKSSKTMQLKHIRFKIDITYCISSPSSNKHMSQGKIVQKYTVAASNIN